MKNNGIALRQMPGAIFYLIHQGVGKGEPRKREESLYL